MTTLRDAPVATRRTALAVALLVAGAALAADSADLVRLGWAWSLALTCVCAGIALIAVAPESRAMYVGALARFTDRPLTLWSLRAATVIAAPVAGLGPVVYALLALAQALLEPLPRELLPDWRRALGTALLGVGFVIGACELGLQIGDEQALWLTLSVAAGLSGFWWLAGPSRAVRAAFFAVVALMLLSLTMLETSDTESLILAAAAGALAITLIAGPRVLRSSRILAAERARRARSEERAEVAELVHDSVLQTLALIQSRAEDPAEVKALARTQERDLRARLFDDADPLARPESIAVALRAAAAEVEDAHRVKIDVVTVGDAPLDERSRALTAAAREALFNAVTHAPKVPVSMFAEVDDRRVEVYVRDRGPGFDLESIPPDRRGVTDSIVARMVRHGGHAAIRTAPGGGCEVRLVLERGA